MTTAPRHTPLTLRELHSYVGGELVGSPDATVTGVASLEEAGPDDLAFLTSERNLKSPQTATIGALLVGRRLPDCPSPWTILRMPLRGPPSSFLRDRPACAASPRASPVART